MNWNKLFWHGFQLQVGLRAGKFFKRQYQEQLNQMKGRRK